MGYSESSSSSICVGGGVWCKKHPRHKQSPGVCSCCLREKLSFHLNSSSSFSSIHSSSVISSYSPSPETCSPPPIHSDNHQNQTIATTTTNKANDKGMDDDQISSTTASGNLDEYRRSHSSGVGGGIGEGSGGKKKSGAGFLLKFLKPTTKKCSRMVCMMQHSKTMNEARTKRFY